MLNIVIYENLCKHVHSITNGNQNMSILLQMSKSNPSGHPENMSIPLQMSKSNP